jgi:ABC-type lipoprotein release transport system permease subunit
MTRDRLHRASERWFRLLLRLYPAAFRDEIGNAVVLIGLPGIYLTGDVIRGLLIDVSPWDPLTLLVVTTGLAMVTIAACYVPARRVMRLDPAPLLRQE